MSRQETYFKLADSFQEVSDLFESLGNQEIPELPSPPDVPELPPVAGPLTDKEIQILNAVYSGQGPIQISKQNPSKFPGPIGIEVGKNSPANGYGVSLAGAWANFAGNVTSLGASKDMPLVLQERWHKYLYKTEHPTAIRLDNKERIWVDYYRSGKTGEGGDKKQFSDILGALTFANVV